MTVEPFIAKGLLVALALLLAVYACTQLRAALRRRARRRYHLQTVRDSEAALMAQAPARPAISPERVASISTDAQQAAWRVARNVEPQAANPHPARTREFVLWEATFHSALSDFTELAEEEQAEASKDDARQ